MNMSNMEWYIVAGVVIGSVFVVILGLFALVKAFYIKVPQGTALIINDTTSQPKVKFTGGLVRSAVVDGTQGYGSVEDGGAGLNVQMRSPERALGRGTEIVLIEHLPEHNAWRVVSKAEFDGTALPR